MKDRARSQFRGTWRIVTMEVWDKDYLDIEVPAYITFAADQMGEFQFGTVRGWIDYRMTERDGRPSVEFSWEGESEGDASCGRGWAVFDGAKLSGRFFIHRGDDSSFQATRANK